MDFADFMPNWDNFPQAVQPSVLVGGLVPNSNSDGRLLCSSLSTTLNNDKSPLESLLNDPLLPSEASTYFGSAQAPRDNVTSTTVSFADEVVLSPTGVHSLLRTPYTPNSTQHVCDETIPPHVNPELAFGQDELNISDMKGSELKSIDPFVDGQSALLQDAVIPSVSDMPPLLVFDGSSCQKRKRRPSVRVTSSTSRRIYRGYGYSSSTSVPSHPLGINTDIYPIRDSLPLETAQFTAPTTVPDPAHPTFKFLIPSPESTFTEAGNPLQRASFDDVRDLRALLGVSPYSRPLSPFSHSSTDPPTNNRSLEATPPASDMLALPVPDKPLRRRKKKPQPSSGSVFRRARRQSSHTSTSSIPALHPDIHTYTPPNSIILPKSASQAHSNVTPVQHTHVGALFDTISEDIQRLTPLPEIDKDSIQPEKFITILQRRIKELESIPGAQNSKGDIDRLKSWLKHPRIREIIRCASCNMLQDESDPRPGCRWMCFIDGCGATYKSRSSQNLFKDLDGHLRIKRFTCPYPGCGKNMQGDLPRHFEHCHKTCYYCRILLSADDKCPRPSCKKSKFKK